MTVLAVSSIIAHPAEKEKSFRIMEWRRLFIGIFLGAPGQGDDSPGQLLRCPEGFGMAVPGGTHFDEQGTPGQILIEPLGAQGQGTGDPGNLPLQLGLEL